MIKSNGWLNTLITLVTIASPALIGFYLMFPDWRKSNNFSHYLYWIIAFSFVLYACFVSWAFIKTKVLAYDSMAFIIPIALVFAGLFVTAKLDFASSVNTTIRVIIGIVMMLSAWPLNEYASNLRYKKIKELKLLQKKYLKK